MCKRHCLIVFFFVIISCKKEPPKTNSIQLQGSVFGTTYSIIYYDIHIDFDKEINQLFDQINKATSTYISSSDISRINKGEKGVKVDSYFREIFFKSEKIFEETNGYFDPTVGSLVNAWGFGPEKSLSEIDSSKVKELLQFTGFEKVSIEDDIVIKKYPEIYFDFNSIAKGYGLDVVSRFLESQGVKNYLIEIGGEVKVKGTKPKGKLWTVQLDNPNSDGTRSAYTYLQLTNKSMASSGNYRKYRIASNGEKYVHTINPKTGFATESNLLSATVIAELDCADVDAYATAFMAMGLEKTKEFLEKKPELKVILIYLNDQGQFTEFRN
ncbi:MAG: FAD:protein FMN transferase [Flavobacterium sp. SCGC AAA160-P02]|nr:MAG: FAD:protein FMN transferase [Flavobacterium sp. SCGC AAA160-P02]